MLPDQPEITRCASCGTYYWLTDVPVVAELGPFGSVPEDAPEEWTRADELIELSLEEYHHAISEGLGGNHEREVHLRTRAWWVHNDRFRTSEPTGELSEADPGFSSAMIANLLRLYEILPADDPGARLMKAEIAREVGNFAGSLELLSQKLPEQYKEAANVIRNLCEQRLRVVHEFRWVR